MFGALRFFWAMMVVLAHLAHFGSGLAVFGFYTLSGYLMTYIMNRKYHFTRSGIAAYILNRFLRIFPAYWFVCLITLFFLHFFDQFFVDAHKALRLPQTINEILSNIFIFGLMPLADENGLKMARLVPTAWALHVELVFYVLIGIGLVRYKLIVVAWFVTSCMYHFLGVIKDWSLYYPVYAASLPFSLGAMIFFYRDRLKEFIPTSNRIAVIMMSLNVVYFVISHKIPFNKYPGLFLFSLLIYQLSYCDFSPTIKRLDAFLGSLSYPIYLSHLLIGELIKHFFELPKSFLLVFYSAIPILIFSLFIAKFIDAPIEKIRRKVSPSASHEPDIMPKLYEVQIALPNRLNS
jgi:peptidoglycan/LPS O-acetylase OafA/YrhL